MVTMKKEMRTVVVGLLLFLLMVSSGCIEDNGSPFREPKVIFVSLDGTGNYTRIQDALDAALAGKKVAVQTSTPYGCSVKYK